MHRQSGFTLVELAIGFVVVGLLMGAILVGQALITGARARNVIGQQADVQTAYLGFQDRYRGLPGDYVRAMETIRDVAGNGDGDGRIEPPGGSGGGGGNGNGNGNNGNNGNGNGANGSGNNGNGNHGNGNGNGHNNNGNGNGSGTGNGGAVLVSGPPSEQVLVWDHLSHAGFINGTYSASVTVSVSVATTPLNPYNAFIDLVYDAAYHGTGNVALRHNLKTGGGIPVEVLAEADRKTDDGNAATGMFRGSTYGSAGGISECWDSLGNWLTKSGQPNCGGAMLL